MATARRAATQSTMRVERGATTDSVVTGAAAPMPEAAGLLPVRTVMRSALPAGNAMTCLPAASETAGDWHAWNAIGWRLIRFARVPEEVVGTTVPSTSTAGPLPQARTTGVVGGGGSGRIAPRSGMLIDDRPTGTLIGRRTHADRRWTYGICRLDLRVRREPHGQGVRRHGSEPDDPAGAADAPPVRNPTGLEIVISVGRAAARYSPRSIDPTGRAPFHRRVNDGVGIVRSRRSTGVCLPRRGSPPDSAEDRGARSSR